jgi:hypothetical protein
MKEALSKEEKYNELLSAMNKTKNEWHNEDEDDDDPQEWLLSQ